MANSASVGAFLRLILHDPGVVVENLDSVRQYIAGLSMQDGVNFRHCAISRLKKNMAETDRREIKGLVLVLINDGMNLDEIIEEVTE